jgi:hypothetical protein
MTITTEEAERLADKVERVIGVGEADVLRDLAAERDALRAEKVNIQDDLASVERERAHQHGRADRNAAEYAREQKKREQLQAENARLEEAMEMARDCLEDKDVIGARQTLAMAIGETQ